MALKLTPIREIRFANVPKTISMLYSPGVCANYTEREMLLVTQNPRRAKVLHKLENRPDDCLYWDFVTETSGISFACARNHFRRQWNDAFRLALKQNGLDFHGRTILPSSGQAEEAGLRGTLEVRIFAPMYKEYRDHATMLYHSNNIVKGLMSLQQRGASDGAAPYLRRW